MHYDYELVLNVNKSKNDNSRSNLGLSVVVPLLNEVAILPDLVENLETLNAEQIIMVDGGSHDGTYEWLQHNWECATQRVISSKAGRAEQMNAGAALATEHMLLFLHADSRLALGAKYEICGSGRPQVHWGRFDIEFDSKDILMRVIAWFMNWRSRLTGISTGDQGIYMHISLYQSVKGFERIPLMEDIVICNALGKIMPPHSSTMGMQTSARRWQENGVISTVLKMWWLRLRFYFGVPVEKLHKSYRDVR